MLFAVVATSFAFAQQPGDGESLSALMQEREQTLQKLVDIARTKYKHGEASLDFLVAAERELLDAQLDSATTARERIVILESQLRVATQHEDRMAKLVENADASPSDLMTAKANRLTAQIALLQERQKQASANNSKTRTTDVEPLVLRAKLEIAKLRLLIRKQELAIARIELESLSESHHKRLQQLAACKADLAKAKREQEKHVEGSELILQAKEAELAALQTDLLARGSNGKQRTARVKLLELKVRLTEAKVNQLSSRLADSELLHKGG